MLHPRARDRARARTRTCSRCATRSARSVERGALSVGRDGASDAVSFLEAGVPAVEFGPVGGGHHGPEEWVSVASLRALPRRRSATSSPRLPGQLKRQRAERPARRRGGCVDCPPRDRLAGGRRSAAASRAADAPARRAGRPRDRPAAAPRSSRPPLLLEVNEIVQAFVQRDDPDPRRSQRSLDDVAGGQAADDPGPRLRPALRRARPRASTPRARTR